MSEHDYYSAFVRALWQQPGIDPMVASLMAQPAFAVYRNTVFKGCVDALAGNYPAVSRLVGEQWFQGVALDFARDHMPDDACLIAYGRDFPTFLAGLEAIRELPYLPGVAALERCWTESHLAADDAELDTDALHTALAAGGDICLVPHAAARWRWEPEHPAYSIWSANRDLDSEPPAQFDWHGEGALLTRPDSQVLWRCVGPGACCFLEACRAGSRISAAVEQALSAQPEMDAASMLAELLQAGAFTSFH